MVNFRPHNIRNYKTTCKFTSFVYTLPNNIETRFNHRIPLFNKYLPFILSNQKNFYCIFELLDIAFDRLRWSGNCSDNTKVSYMGLLSPNFVYNTRHFFFLSFLMILAADSVYV